MSQPLLPQCRAQLWNYGTKCAHSPDLWYCMTNRPSVACQSWSMASEGPHIGRQHPLCNALLVHSMSGTSLDAQCSILEPMVSQRRHSRGHGQFSRSNLHHPMYEYGSASHCRHRVQRVSNHQAYFLTRESENSHVHHSKWTSQRRYV